MPSNKQKTPQEAIDEFWARFTTKAPGKATIIIPQNEYAAKAARRTREGGIGTTTQASYEEAAAVCRTKVAKIVKECRRVNQKYRDPHFDLEFDLKCGLLDTLQTLRNVADAKESSFKPRSVKRVVDVFDEAKFYVDGPTANDVRQGRDGDCWLLAALCTLSNKPGLIERCCVARDEQVGVYGFVFHRDGEWISEIIDDKLFLTKPDFEESFLERMLWEDRERVNSEEQYRRAYQTGSGALYFAQCEQADETWLPLLEKAYAKAHGDYAAIEGGFTGEGIEDLTGGVTSELYAADILDKEYFWQEELLKVNKDFLFGCSTGMWGGGWGDRTGIVERHAYSIMRAVEMDGHRLLLLKNPWGKGEWRGPWSDGSKEWTAEWLLKLNHRFGDDGSFWISYEDLLRKYQAFDRTRLFGIEWKVTSVWTTLSVPWALDYNDTQFALSLSRPGPVVLVLSQLDDRYFRGLEGQYRYQLNFRLHKRGKEDYVVRTISPYGQSRSVNVELHLEAGHYTVLLKINATRNMNIMPIEQVIRNNARDRRDKLVAVGMSYDLAHSKGDQVEAKDRVERMTNIALRKRQSERESLREKIMEARRNKYYLDVKRQNKRRRRRARTKARRAERKRERAAPKTGSTGKAALATAQGSTGPSFQNKTEAGGIDTTDRPKGDVAVQTVEAMMSGDRSPLETSRNPSAASAPVVSTRAASDGSAYDSQKPRAELLSDSSDTESFMDESDITSVSDMSDREVDIEMSRLANAQAPAAVTAQQPPPKAEEPDEFERSPWNAVATVGLRVYYKVVPGHELEEIVTVAVGRPGSADLGQDQPRGEAGEDVSHADDADADADGHDGEIEKGLDVDDAAKDATLVGDTERRKKSIAPAAPGENKSMLDV